MRVWIHILFFILSASALSAQTNAVFIEGVIHDKVSSAPLAYASVYDKTSGKGTISNAEGYFKLQVQNISDSIFISYLGYKNQKLLLEANTRFYRVFLEENVHSLQEVTIVAGNNNYLYDLLAACRKNQPNDKIQAKAYYELKSRIDSEQVELVECFYNGTISGYDIEKLELKTGRIALQPMYSQLFISMESSKAISMLKLFEYNTLFPLSPLELSSKKLKKAFYLTLHSKYASDNKDSIYILDFMPKDSSGKAFSGRLWVNFSRKNIEKINLVCKGTKTHPFLPLFPHDTLESVDFNITKTFEEVNGKITFKHIDFTYNVQYVNRNKEQFEVITNAVLYFYDYNRSFTSPKFSYSNTNINDYKKINAIPYNAYFWENNSELKLSHRRNENEVFFNNEYSITNKTLFQPNNYLQIGLLERPYVMWNGNRVRFREFTADTNASTISPNIVAEQYNLSVKLFLDINTIGDSTQVITATILDPYESFYKLPLDNAALCFINTYYDLVEIERRKLEDDISKSDRKTETIYKLYEESQRKISKLRKTYYSEVEHGRNRRQMEKWNKYVYSNLDINNIDFFKPYAKE